MNKKSNQKLELPYTIGFCILHDTVLMLHRKFQPNQNLWNGIGGKIDSGETPDEGIAREVMEEAHLDVNKAKSIKFVGIVTWAVVQDESNNHKGMYAYIIEFSNPVGWKNKNTEEGLLEWKSYDWVINKDNQEVVDNLPYLLPLMLEAAEPIRYHCHYIDGNLEEVSRHPLIS